MGKIVIPKNSASLEEVMGAMQIYYDANDWVSNADFISEYKVRIGVIGDDRDSSAYTKKTEIGAYYGFLEWEDINKTTSPRRITPRGRLFLEHYNSGDMDAVHEDLMKSLEEISFGRNNYACRSCDSDIEPPALFLRAMIDLGHLTNTEFAYLVYRMEYEGMHYTETIQEIKNIRDSGSVIDLHDDAKKFSDPKPILILERWGVLASQKIGASKCTSISASFFEKYKTRLKNLKIYNIDKNIVNASSVEQGSEEDDVDDNEKQFRAWLSKQITVAGKVCSPSAVSNNCSALRKVCQLMDIAEYPDLESIFEISDIDIFVEVKNIIKNHPDYDAVNLACNNRYLSTGLKWYEKFLNELLQEDIAVQTGEDNQDAKEEIDESTRISGGTNILLYGVPGSGKSWTIEHEYCKPGTIVERLVFHPDYTNADFVGQILPVVDPEDKMVTYEFVPGPFTNIIRDAYFNPQKKFVLIIEEINRGNAPAIFGDVFQLLDRLVEAKTIEGVTYQPGTSEYGITNKNVAKAVYGDETRKVRIPSNLSILGTMNTSDQNVFTLDTAFQRRWRMRLIENNFNNVRSSLANAEILDTKITWQKFCDTVNGIIVGNKAKMASAEDKRLGVYFIHESDMKFDTRALPGENYPTLTVEVDALMKKELLSTITEDEKSRLAEIRDAIIQNRIFPEKVLKYLWDDAFKFNPEAFFDTENMKSLEDVIRTFVFSKGKERFKVCSKTVRQLLFPDEQ